MEQLMVGLVEDTHQRQLATIHALYNELHLQQIRQQQVQEVLYQAQEDILQVQVQALAGGLVEAKALI
jgi:hypothetical protein